MSKKTDLVTTEAAAETLRIDAAEVEELIESGDLRKIWHRSGNSSDSPLDSFVLGSDVQRLKQENSPAYLAKLVNGEIVEDDDEGNNPRNLAQSVPRL